MSEILEPIREKILEKNIEEIVKIFIKDFSSLESFNRWIISENWEICECWFLDKFHSEFENNIKKWERIYTFLIKDKNWKSKKILFSYNDNISFSSNDFDYFFSPKNFLLLSKEQFLKLQNSLDIIKEIENKRRLDRKISTTSIDEKVHILLDI